MNIEEILLPPLVYKVMMLLIITANLLWGFFRKKFLQLLKENEPKLWLELESPKGYFIFGPFKVNKVEAFISKKKWRVLKSEKLKLAAQKALYAHRLFIFMAVLFILFLFGPLLAHQISLNA